MSWRRWHVTWLDGIAEASDTTYRGSATAPRLARRADNDTGVLPRLVEVGDLSSEVGANE